MRVLYFTAPWCGPCKAFGPRLEAFAKENGVELQKIDADGAEPSLLERFRVLALPTTVWYRGDTILDVRSGALSPQEMRSVLSL